MKKFDESFKIGTKVKLSQHTQSNEQVWFAITEINEARNLIKVAEFQLWIPRERICGYTNTI